MKTKSLCLMFLNITLLVSASSVFAENSWIINYTDNVDIYKPDVATAIAIDAKDNICVTGHGYAQDTCADFMTVKYNKSGDVKWIKKYSGLAGQNDYADAIAVDKSGDVYVTGTSFLSEFESEIVTIKYTSAGNSGWTVSYHTEGYGSFLCQAKAIMVDSMKNIYVTGTIGTSGTTYDYLTIKYNSLGLEEWVATYNGIGNSDDQPAGLVLDNVGNVYVGGYSMGRNSNYDMTIVKYDAGGNQKWVSRYDSKTNILTADDLLTGIGIDDKANIYITGYSNDGLSQEWATAKIDPNGNILWVKNYQGTGGRDDIATAIAVDGAGNSYVAGYTNNLLSNYDFTTVKYDPFGQMLWAKTYNSSGNYQDFANAVALDKQGGVYVTGTSYKVTNVFDSDTTYDISTLKYSIAGDSIWAAKYSLDRAAKSEEIKIDSKYNVCVLGKYILIKYVQRRY